MAVERKWALYTNPYTNGGLRDGVSSRSRPSKFAKGSRHKTANPGRRSKAMEVSLHNRLSTDLTRPSHHRRSGCTTPASATCEGATTTGGELAPPR